MTSRLAVVVAIVIFQVIHAPAGKCVGIDRFIAQTPRISGALWPPVCEKWLSTDFEGQTEAYSIARPGKRA